MKVGPLLLHSSEKVRIDLMLCLFADWEAPDDFHPEETLPEEDFARCEFLDLSKPLLRQVWESNFSKEFYLQQVHQPRHVTKTARLFGPDYLEVRSPALRCTCWLEARAGFADLVVLPLGAYSDRVVRCTTGLGAHILCDFPPFGVAIRGSCS